MATATKCKCQRCVISGLMGPVVLITIGALFLIGHMRFFELWPILLIVIGLVKLAEAMASTEGHTGP